MFFFPWQSLYWNFNYSIWCILLFFFRFVSTLCVCTLLMRNSLYCYFTNVLPVSYKTVLVMDYDLHFHLPIFSLKAKLNCFLALFNCIYTCTHWLKAEYEDDILFSFFSHHSFFFRCCSCCSYLDCTFHSSFFFRFSKFSFLLFFLSSVLFLFFSSHFVPSCICSPCTCAILFCLFWSLLNKAFPYGCVTFHFFLVAGCPQPSKYAFSRALFFS